MKKTEALEDCYFLNRLALNEMANAKSVDPIEILNRIFEFGEMDEMKARLGDFCDAALAEEYAGREKSPANLLFFCEQLEAMIEACFLIYSRRKKTENKSGQPVNPFAIIETFFAYRTLPEWKKALHDWMEAAFSAYSVIETIEPGALLGFPRQLEKLIEAACLLSSRLPKKK